MKCQGGVPPPQREPGRARGGGLDPQGESAVLGGGCLTPQRQPRRPASPQRQPRRPASGARDHGAAVPKTKFGGELTHQRRRRKSPFCGVWGRESTVHGTVRSAQHTPRTANGPMCTNANSSFDGRECRITHLRCFCVRSNRNGRILLVVPFIIERKGARLLDLKAGFS